MENRSDAKVLGGILEPIGSVEVSGPSIFSLRKLGLSVQGYDVSTSKHFREVFDKLPETQLGKRPVHAWRLLEVNPQERITASKIFSHFRPEISLVDIGHVKEVLALQLHKKSPALLNEDALGNIFCAKGADGKPCTVRLSRTKPGSWVYSAVFAPGPLADTHIPGTHVLSY